jgi:hypothetical protein
MQTITGSDSSSLLNRSQFLNCLKHILERSTSLLSDSQPLESRVKSH